MENPGDHPPRDPSLTTAAMSPRSCEGPSLRPGGYDMDPMGPLSAQPQGVWSGQPGGGSRLGEQLAQRWGLRGEREERNESSSGSPRAWRPGPSGAATGAVSGGCSSERPAARRVWAGSPCSRTLCGHGAEAAAGRWPYPHPLCSGPGWQYRAPRFPPPPPPPKFHLRSLCSGLAHPGGLGGALDG